MAANTSQLHVCRVALYFIVNNVFTLPTDFGAVALVCLVIVAQGNLVKYITFNLRIIV